MLTHAKAKAIKEAGRYGDGGGLYLVVARGGSKSWILRMMRDGKRRDMGLVGFPVSAWPMPVRRPPPTATP